MNDSNSLSNGESQNLDILSLARGIYELLSINKEIESEDELFSDEVYIEIITKISPDIQDEISPGSTPEEKVEIIKMLLSLLGNLVEANLSKINPKKLVLEHDKDSAKNFLELLLELIQAIINNGGEELEDDDDNSMGMRGNISDGNIKKKKTKADSFDKEEEVNMDDLESLKLSRDKKNDKKNKNENEESEEMKIDGNFMLDKEKSQSEKNIIFDLENNEGNNEVNKSNSKVMNVSHISDDIKDEKKEDLENNKNNISNKDKDNNIDNNDIENDIFNDNDNDNDNDDKLNSNKKYDIPALLEGEGEAEEHDDKDKNKKSTEDFNYIDNDDEDISKKEIKFEENKYNFQGSDDDLSSNNVKDSAYSVPQPYNKFVLTNNNSSEEYGDSILKKEKQKEKAKDKKKKEEEEDDIDLNYNDELDEKDLNLNIDKNSNTSLLNSNISLHSKKSKKSNRIDDSKFQDSSNKKGSSKKKESVVGGGKKSINSSSKKGSHVNTNKSNNDFENENDLSESQSNDISKSSVYTIPQGQKSVASSKKNSKISKKNENNNNNLNKSNKSNISKKSKSKSSCSTIINSEIPLDDKELKYELIKELKKMYGNKLDKALFENNNVLDIIIQDLKLTKKQENLRKKESQQKTESKDQDKDKEKSIDKNIDIYNTDDVFLSKEFLKRNQKQLQQKLQMYNQKLKQRQIDQEKYIRDIGQNVQFMKKIRELEQKKLENDILRKKELLKNNNNAEEIYFCQKVYDNYFLLEKDKKDKEIESITMLNNMKLNEKLKSINDIERYYRDKIAILNEIGRRERIEKRRSKMEDELIYLQLNSIPKRQLKNKMKQILNSLDDEYYNNVQVDNNNQEEIEKILDNYYKK